jgi:Mechanosensitive ion channel, conserved TM helix
MSQGIINLFVSPLLDVWHRILAFMPNILAALLFLLLGLVLARFASTIIGKTLGKINLDDYTSRIGINEIFTRIGFGRSPVRVVTFLVYWAILLFFVMLAANSINMASLTNFLEKFISFIPQLVVAIVILFAGLLFGKFIHDVVSNSATANNIKGGRLLAKFVHGAIIFLATLTALQQIKIEIGFILSVINVVLASFGLAFALAVGLGAKDHVSRYLESLTKKK